MLLGWYQGLDVLENGGLVVEWDGEGIPPRYEWDRRVRYADGQIESVFAPSQGLR